MINEKINFSIIKTMRKKRGITRTQLCKMSGIPLSTLHDLEEGITANPRLLTLIAIADAFQLDLSGFIALLQE